jgi:hypothetical protein
MSKVSAIADKFSLQPRSTQTQSGFVTVQAPAATFVLRSGTPRTYIKVAASGNKRAHGFCSDCGTPIYATDLHEPRSYGIRVGTLKQRGQLLPSRQVWYRSALAWATDLPFLMSPDKGLPGNGLFLFFRVDDFDMALQRARTLDCRLDEEPRVNPATETREFSLRDPDGYYVTISALSAA